MMVKKKAAPKSTPPAPIPAEKPKPRTQVLYEELLQRLPKLRPGDLPDSATEAEALDPDHSEFQRFLRRQPEPVRKALGDSEADRAPEYPTYFRWCLCEQPDGDYPKVRIFTDPAKLVRYMASLEGQDVAVCPLFGIPLRFTRLKDGQRFLYLPGEQQAMLISPAGTLSPIDVSLLGDKVEFQQDGWVGEICLAEGTVSEFYLGNLEERNRRAAAKKSKAGEDKKDDEDEDDDGDEEDGVPYEQ